MKHRFCGHVITHRNGAVLSVVHGTFDQTEFHAIRKWLQMAREIWHDSRSWDGWQLDGYAVNRVVVTVEQADEAK